MVTSTVPSLADSSAPLSVSGTTRAARGFRDNAGGADRRAKGRSGAQLPTTGDRRQIVGPAAQLGADIADQLVEVGVPADHTDASTARGTGCGAAKITASMRPIHSRQRI